MSQWDYGTKQEGMLAESLLEKDLFKGLTQVVGSGNQFYAKEDLTNTLALCQVKSTKDLSLSVSTKDVKKLVYNAFAVFKFPVFIVNFSKPKIVKFLVLKSFVNSYPQYLTPKFSQQFTISKNKKITTLDFHKEYLFDDITMLLLAPSDFR